MKVKYIYKYHCFGLIKVVVHIRGFTLNVSTFGAWCRGTFKIVSLFFLIFLVFDILENCGITFSVRELLRVSSKPRIPLEQFSEDSSCLLETFARVMLLFLIHDACTQIHLIDQWHGGLVGFSSSHLMS